VTSISADSLATIGGQFHLDTLTAMTGLTFARLATVNSLVWNALPQLQGINFNTGLQTVGQLDIRNTGLQSLSGINLKTASSIYISNNVYLTSINMQLKTVSGAMTLDSNANGNLTANFPNLIGASAITIANTSELTINSLEYVNKTFALYGNSFQTVAMPNLTTTGDFVLDNNDQMTNFTIPSLTTVNGVLSVENNTAYTGDITFPKVTRVTGALIVQGGFSR